MNRRAAPERPSVDQQVTFLSTPDLAATDAFYREVLGFSLILDQGVCRIYRVSDSAFLGFCRETENIDAVTAEGVILTLVVDSTAQVDRWSDYLATTHAHLIEKAPALNEQFNIYHLFLRDPNGYLVEIQCFLDPTWPTLGPQSRPTT